MYKLVKAIIDRVIGRRAIELVIWKRKRIDLEVSKFRLSPRVCDTILVFITLNKKIRKLDRAIKKLKGSRV